MESNGWIIDVQYWAGNDWNKENREVCGITTFYGYRGDNSIGMVTTTFTESGRAILNFGNCYNGGYVSVSLNDNEIGRAYANTPINELRFIYSKHDILRIEEVNTAIIKLNSLDFLCNGKLYIKKCNVLNVFRYNV